MSLRCVLFDLDGTLADTAPDLLASLDYALRQRGWPVAAQPQVQPAISRGALAMIRASLPHANATEQQTLLTLLLDYYELHIARHTRLFPGIEALLSWLEQHGLMWGVVTNKRQRFTLPLMRELGLYQRAACIISGDSTAHSKPHPEPMLTACAQIGVTPAQCLYLGDARHDITAGQAAGMTTLAASYGYIAPDDDPNQWGADGLITEPSALRAWITLS
ncbi:MAG: phosphoglycolate phosphatase [Methylococcales bacterium]|nr:phosphoglycolate phosphatase [Methylococcales bacterium]